jgi:hypothetical protein
MKRDKRIKLLKEWEACYNKNNEIWNKLDDIFHLYPDSPIGRAIWDTFGLYTKSLSRILGDNGEWLDWYCWENDMGKNTYEAKASKWKESQIISSIEILCDLIEVDLK